MQRDPLIEEIHAGREAFAKEHNYDLAAMVATLRRHQRKSGRDVVTLAPQPLAAEVQKPVKAASAGRRAAHAVARPAS